MRLSDGVTPDVELLFPNHVDHHASRPACEMKMMVVVKQQHAATENFAAVRFYQQQNAAKTRPVPIGEDQTTCLPDLRNMLYHLVLLL